ncbi:hypothetical protein OCU04_010054 [Sclerotinia nivalis]|uniref:Uncharacterized protein n=1 Tax=Sclerotinia nivalis TaxID=352851 RepID=A0A9X0ADT1_9HELO|nr:hypothetical protein OCU04_010054 [Sclerotinia nivalis]
MKSRRRLLLAVRLAVSSIIVTAILLFARHGTLNVTSYFGSPAPFHNALGYEYAEVDDDLVGEGSILVHDCNVTENFQWLAKYNLSYPLKVAHRDIVAKPNHGARPSITTLDESLFDSQEIFRRAELSIDRVVDHCSPITLEVPYPPIHKIDASHMIFGLQTTIKRLRDTKPHLARWLPNTGARMIAIVKESEEKLASKSEMARLQKEYRKAGMDVTIIPPVKKEDFFNQR